MVENLVIGSDFQQNVEASKTLHGIKRKSKTQASTTTTRARTRPKKREKTS